MDIPNHKEAFMLKRLRYIKVLALILSLVMVFSATIITSFASQTEETQSNYGNTEYLAGFHPFTPEIQEALFSDSEFNVSLFNQMVHDGYFGDLIEAIPIASEESLLEPRFIQVFSWSQRTIRSRNDTLVLNCFGLPNNMRVSGNVNIITMGGIRRQPFEFDGRFLFHTSMQWTYADWFYAYTVDIVTSNGVEIGALPLVVRAP